MSDQVYPQIGVRRFGPVNWLGLWTLYVKEIWRFFKVGTQTVLAPVGTSLLFLAIFSVAVGRHRPEIHGVAFAEFLAPGIIMMTIIQNAFANTSSSLLISKVQGNMVDFLMPPLSPGELTAAFVLGGMTRGVVVAVITGLGMWMFVDMQIAHPWAVAYFAIGASLMLAQLGVIGGIWAEKFDHMQAVINFFIMPLSFLSGTFYSISSLPPAVQMVSLVNPFFYMIDGFRYGFIGHTDASILTAAVLVGVINAVLWVICYLLFRSGWRLKF